MLYNYLTIKKKNTCMRHKHVKCLKQISMSTEQMASSMVYKKCKINPIESL